MLAARSCCSRPRAVRAAALLAGVLLLLQSNPGDAHGTLTKPTSRAVQMTLRATAVGPSTGPAPSEAIAHSGSCAIGECEWYTQDTVIPGNATNCEARHRTMGVVCGAENPTDYPCTPGGSAPWCAPGSAPVKSPCGVFAGGGPLLPKGRDMLDLPGVPVATWTAGDVVEVAWSMVANHGGGYSYRLCPATQAPTEACFQAHALRFAGDRQTIVNVSGDVVATIPAVRLDVGTQPAGSQWARNPIPLERGMIQPIAGLPELFGRGPFPYSVVDALQLPAADAGFAAGHYVLSWRWDAEQTTQVWAQCSDVLIIQRTPDDPAAATASPAQSSPAAAAATPRDTVCVEESLGLDTEECAAWVAFYDATNGAHWRGHTNASALKARTNPCGAISKWWEKTVICSSFRDYKHITEMYIMGSPEVGGADVRGVLPQAMGGLAHLRVLSLVSTQVSGALPASLGRLPRLQMLWLDHNPRMGGTIPASLAALNLTVFELQYSNFSGALPPLDYASIPDCMLYNNRWGDQGGSGGGNNVFECPLPEGAESCGAVCHRGRANPL